MCRVFFKSLTCLTHFTLMVIPLSPFSEEKTNVVSNLPPSAWPVSDTPGEYTAQPSHKLC